MRNKILMLICLVLCYISGGILINNHNRLLSLLFPQKVWIHRVNSIEKLKEVHQKHSRIELDVEFEEFTNSFEVNHPPAKSINLSLIEYFSSINIESDNRFWLDFKNLSETNMKSSCLKLDSICSIFNLNKKQIIVESTKPKFLKSFNANGYITSYYLPQRLVLLDEPLLNEKIDAIRSIISKNKTTYISTDVRDYKILKKYFAHHKILTWSFPLDGPKQKSLNPISLLKALKQFFFKYKFFAAKNVHVVLFQYEAKEGNR